MFDDPSVDRLHLQAVGVGSTAVLGVVTFVAQVRAYNNMMSFVSPADRADFRESFRLRPPPLTLQAVWSMLGPAATGATLKRFQRTHGMAAFSIVTASLVSSLLCAHFQPVFESFVVPNVNAKR